MDHLVVERNIEVPMRDGTELAADVYRPSDSNRYPTLVQRIPYDKSDAGAVGDLVFNPLDMAQQGYAIVVQDTRGRFESEGGWQPFHDEAIDGYDTIEWTASQPWSTGRVGIYGSSYMGVTALQAAVADPPHLEAVLAYMTGSNYHDGWTYSGGAFELGFNFRWVLGFLQNHINRADVSPERKQELEKRVEETLQNLDDAYRHTPYHDHPAIPDELAPYWKEWLDHPEYDDYWNRVDVTARADDLSVPVLHIGGWYDLFLKGHLDLFQTINERAQDSVADEQRFIIGPWDHESYQSKTPSKVGDYVFGPSLTSGAPFVSGIATDWFDRWLCDEQTGVDDWSPVEYFVTGDDEWRSTSQWPPEREIVPYYFHSAGDAAEDISDGELRDEPPSEQPPDTYEYDPTDPVPTCGGRILMPRYRSGGIRDQSEIERRDDVLTYTSPTLDSPTRIGGPVEVVVFAESTAPATDFTAKLVDVHPDGYCANVCEGITRARYRDSTEHEQFLEPGTVHELSIDLWSMAHTFGADHRIRVEISSSNFPRFDRNPNTKTHPAHATEADMTTAIQQIHHDDDARSHLRLPVVAHRETIAES